MKEYKVYKVEGMTCNHCKASVENGIRGLDAEGEVLADPNTNELRVSSGRISEEAIRSTVESLGYQFKGKKSD